jgi:hypothetical protein
VNVTVECLCPGAAHPDGDTITLRDKLDFHAATTIRQSLKLLEQPADTAEILATLTEKYLLFGIESWTLVDERGKAIPVSRQTITERILGDPIGSAAIADEADELYAPTVLLPLVARASKSSKPSPTSASTSQPTDSPTKRPKRSSPSSISTSPTGGTATITSLHGGDSSSSPSSTSAA